MNRRVLGIILLFTLLVLLGSGIYMYFKPFNKSVASIHTFFGFLFILATILHLSNNKKPLSNYISGKRKPLLQKLQTPVVLILVILLSFGLYFNLPGLSFLYKFGNEIRNRQSGKVETHHNYEKIKLNQVIGKHKIEIELKKGNAFQYPLFAIWAEDSLGNYIETLYISRVIATSSFVFGEKKDGIWESAVKRRPEALPYWSHKRGIKASDGLFVPLDNSKDIDAVSGATPTGNFLIETRTNNDFTNYRILLEVNQSYDWNDFYTKDKFPNDEIYSGTGQVGQPSLIYASDIFLTSPKTKTYNFMRLIGHGHHSGKTGLLYQNLTHISTAKEIIDRIILSVNN